MADNNNNYQRPTVRTNGVFYYGHDAKTDKAMSANYFGDKIYIRIHGLANGGQAKYDYQSGPDIYLSGKNAKKLARLINKAREAALKGNDFEAYGVSSGRSLIEVIMPKEVGCDGDIALRLYNNIDPDTTKSKDYSVFVFRNDIIIKNYDGESGSYDKDAIDADIDAFVDQLKEFAKAINGAAAHSIRKEAKFDMDRFLANQKLTMNKLGIELPTTKNLKSGWNAFNNNSNNSSSSEISVITGGTDIIDEIDEVY